MKRYVLVDDNQSLLTNIQQWSFDIEIFYVDWVDWLNCIVDHNTHILDLDDFDQDAPLKDKNIKLNINNKIILIKTFLIILIKNIL